MSTDPSEQLQQLSRRHKQIEKSYSQLQRTVDQLKSVSQSQSQSQDLNQLDNVTLLKFLKEIRGAIQEDQEEILRSHDKIKEQSKIISAVRSQLVTVRERVINIPNESSNNKDKELRELMKKKLILLKNEISNISINEGMSNNSLKLYNKKDVIVTYWNGRGRCEPIRLLLSCVNIEFTNNFLTKKEDLENLRKSGKLYYDQVPLIEINGENLTQTTAIMKYIARNYNLYGINDDERYKIDLIYEGYQDCRYSFNNYRKHKNKDEFIKQLKAERYFGQWNRDLEKSKSGFFTSRMSLADVVVFELLDYYEDLFGYKEMQTFVKQYPFVHKMDKMIFKSGRIAKYFKERQHLPYDEYIKIVMATLA